MLLFNNMITVYLAYYNYVQSLPNTIPIPLLTTQLDIVFVIDQTSFLRQQSFSPLLDFLVNYVQQFNIGPYDTQVAVLSFDQNIYYPGTFALTRANNVSALRTQIYALTQNTATQATTFNVAGAFDYLINTLLTPNQGHTTGRAAAIIFVASSRFANIPPISQVEQLNALGGVFGLDILGIGASSDYLPIVTNRNERNIFRTTDPIYLNSSSEGFQRLNHFASTVYGAWIYRLQVPSRDVITDMVIVIDSSTAMTSPWFNNIKTWLLSFVARYSISPQLTQISIVLFDNQVQGAPILLNASTNLNALRIAINATTLPTTQTQSAVDHVSAIDYVVQNILQPSSGYRGQSTIVVIIGVAATSASTCDAVSAAAQPLWSVATFYGFALATASTDPSVYLKCALANPGYISVSTPAAPLTDTVAEQKFISTVAQSYQNYIDTLGYVVPIPLSTKSVDLVFVIDRSFFTDNILSTLVDFMKNYVANFNIGPGQGGTQVAAVGAGSSPQPYFALNASNNLAQLQTLIGLIPNNTSSVVTPDLNGTLYHVVTQTLSSANGRRIRIPAVVVVIVGSDFISPVQGSTITALNELAGVFGINLFGAQSTSIELLRINNQNDRALARLGSADSLLNSTSLAVTQLSSYVANSAPPLSVPLFTVDSDIVFVVDGGYLLTQVAFNSVIAWISRFSEQFVISGNVGARLGFLLFTDQPTPPASSVILLNSAQDGSTFRSRLAAVPYPASGAQSFNLLAAINYVNGVILTAPQGWRNRSTIVLFIGISNTSIDNCSTVQNNPGTVQLWTKASTFAIALNSYQLTSEWLHCTLRSTQQFSRADPPTSLTITSLASRLFAEYVAQVYQTYVNSLPYDVPIPLVQIPIDLVFVVDQTVFLSNSSFQFLKDFLVNFVQQFTIARYRTQVAVVSFDEALFEAGTFALTRAENFTQLQSTIYALPYSSGRNSTILGLDASVAYLLTTILRPSQGHTFGRAAAVIYLASTPYATFLPADRIESINAQAGTFGVDILGIGASVDYLPRFTNRNERNIYRTTSPAFLNPSSEGFGRISSFVSHTYRRIIYTPLVTTRAVYSDIVIVVDSSQIVSPIYFANIQSWLAAYVLHYSVGPLLTQFSIVYFDTASRYTTIYLNSTANANDTAAAINSITYTTSAQGFDLAAAINYVQTNVLTEAQGYRSQAFALLLVGFANNSTSTCDQINVARDQLPLHALIYAVAMTSAGVDPSTYLQCALRNPADITATTPAGTITGQYYEHQITYALSLGYYIYIENLNYTLSAPLSTKVVDIIFVIDQSVYVQFDFSTITQFLSNYSANFIIGTANTQFAVIGTNSVVNPYIQLNDSNSNIDLQTRINNITITPSADVTPNIMQSLYYVQYLLQTPEYGSRPNVATVVVIMIGSRELNSVDPSIIAALNARRVNLFGLNLFGDAIVNRYLLSIVGNNERAVGRVYNPSALLSNNTAAVRQLSSFISNSAAP